MYIFKDMYTPEIACFRSARARESRSTSSSAPKLLSRQIPIYMFLSIFVNWCVQVSLWINVYKYLCELL